MAEGMRVLLTGATGFVGRHLHPWLLSRGFRVAGATRHPEQARERHVACAQSFELFELREAAR